MDTSVGFVTQLSLSWEGMLRAASEGEFDYVEVLMDGPYHRRELAADLEAVRSDLADRGLGAAVHLPFPLDLGSPHTHQREGAVEELQACLDVAADLGAEKAVVHPDGTAWGAAWDDDTTRSFVTDSLDELTPYAASLGVELCAENLFDAPFTLAETGTLLAETDVSMTLDTGHAYVSGHDAAAVAEFVADHPDRVSHVHVNDTRRRRDEHVPFGVGAVDFETLFAGFPATWAGTLSLELFSHDPDSLVESRRRLDAVLEAVEG